jgi:hypothetical protein
LSVSLSLFPLVIETWAFLAAGSKRSDPYVPSIIPSSPVCAMPVQRLRLLIQRQPEDFEQVLATLTSDIKKRETRLSEIRLRERRVTLLVTLYTVGFWVAYVSVWYANPALLPILTDGGRASNLEKFIKGVPVALGPVLCVVKLIHL